MFSIHRLLSFACSLSLLWLAAAVALSVSIAALPAKAQDVGIAAIVNDQIISQADVDARIGLISLSDNLPQNSEVQQQLRNQVLHMLITQKLEMQEAKREGVLATQDEAEEQFREIEKSNNMPEGGLDKILIAHGVDKQTMLDQLIAQISWQRLVHARYGPEINVSDKDIANAMKEVQAHDKEPQNRVAEIFLPVTNPSQDEQVGEVAAHLMDEIHQGAKFPAVARQFSQASAAVGGDLGWLAPGMLPPEIEKIIARMQPGSVGGPFRLTGGYYILYLIDRRAPQNQDQATYNLTQVVFPLPDGATDADRAKITQQAIEATQNARSCDDLNAIGHEVSPQLSGPLGNLTADDMPSGLHDIIATAHIAVPLKPVRVHGGIGVFMVCGKSGGSGISREEVEQNLFQQRFQNISQRYLADLERIAYIEIRS